ncbi:ABC transporter permease [Aquamicrobium ahrensii]|uniref:Peptide/nickel transport system permease protein n=1 Tax=Aquamicrobium ahrensii TaxID=469551 RepID=A0ABV2KSC6_9HYPH
MLSLITRRVIATIPVLFLVSVAVFGLMRLLPGDVTDLILSDAQANVSEEQVAELRRQYGIDQPVYIQYAKWVGRLATGDLGVSFRNKQDVGQIILPRLWPTLQIGLMAILLATAVGVPLGALSASFPNSLWDKLGSLITFVGASTPYFLAGGVLIYVVSLQFNLLPPSGYVSPLVDFQESLRRSIMPAVTISLSLAAIILRQSRASFSDVLQLPYIRTAYAKGLSKSTVVLKHALKNALLPVVTILGLQLGLVFSGAVVTETVFAVPGIGRLLVDSILGRDYPVVQALVMIIAVAVTFSTLLVDIVYGALDPRSSRS